MATQRYISTSFWDDRWIRTLNPSDRYLYLYLMTNPLTNIAGVYQTTIDRIAFDTGYDERTLRPMLQKFADARKAIFYHDEWMILPSWPKHQRMGERDKVRKGVDALILALPDDVYAMLFEYGYRYPYLEELLSKRTLKDHARTLNYSDTDSDTDTDSDADTDVAPQDEVLQTYRTEIEAQGCPALSWTDTHKQFAALNDITQRTRALAPDSVLPEPTEFARGIMAVFKRRKETAKTDFWRTASPDPLTLKRRFQDLVTGLADEYQRMQDERAGIEAIGRMYRR